MKIGVIDIETSHFFDKDGTIIEVGIVIIDAKTGMLNKAFSSLCKESGFSEKDKTAWVFENSDLTYEMIDTCGITFDDIRDDIQKVIDSCDMVTAYNKAFDFEFLKDRRVVIEHEAKCIMLEMTKICKVLKPYHWRKNCPDDPFKWVNVDRSWQKLFPDIPYVEKHRAADDAVHEGIICYKMMQKYDINMIEE